VRTPPGVVVKSLLTVGDVVNGYQMAGAPDGLEAFDNGDGTFILLVHHGRTVNTESGRPREGVGTFVSRWVVSADDFTVVGAPGDVDDRFRQNRRGRVAGAEEEHVPESH
jgi:hypothetical protein